MTKFILCLLLLTTYKSAHSKFTTCTNEEECVPFRECEVVRKILADGRVSRDEDIHLKRIQCKFENSMAYVCCADNMNEDRVSLDVELPKLEKQSSPKLDKLPKSPNCGIQFTDRILGGVETNIDEHPWSVQIQYSTPNGQIDSHCGGALINERYVLTAAHCEARLPKDWKITQVRLGDWDTRSNPDCQTFDYEDVKCNDPFVDIPVEKITLHENYNPLNTAQSHDIALIKLQRDAHFTDFIKPICLPVDQDVRTMNLTGHDVEVTGYGRMENKPSSDVKMKVTMAINSQETCENFYKKANVVISSKQMCAGGEKGKDTCNGDSGGPLMKEISMPNKLPYYSLIGLVSFGPTDCGTKDQPGVYTRVSEYIDWIVENMD